jgi:hypothetical protein
LKLRAMLDDVGPAHVTAVLRIGLGVLVAEQTALLLRELRVHFFRDVFNWPMLPDALLPSRHVYTALLLSQLLLAAIIVEGRRARPALVLASLFQLYVMAIDRANYHNYRYTLTLVLFLTSLLPCDRALVWRRPARPGPLWALYLLRAQLSLVYVASAGSKLLDPDWRTGHVIADGIARFGREAMARGVPPWCIDLLMTHWVASLAAKAAIATELSIGLGVWSRRLRAPALWLGLVFHGTIELVTTVGIFGWLMVLSYTAFATPETETRLFRFASPRQRRLVATLDWLRRFRYEAAPVTSAVDRGGETYSGLAAAALVARATPLLFPLWPLLWIASRFRRRDLIK